MSTISHAGRKILRQAIGNPNYAEIADLIYFRVNGSRYFDEKGKPFFLLPNIDHIIEQTGLGKTVVLKCTSSLPLVPLAKDRVCCCYGVQHAAVHPGLRNLLRSLVKKILLRYFGDLKTNCRGITLLI